ncbi:MAG: phosphatidylinositol-specific phospholipase C domain-containing protein, partial [Bacteroidota bacterium]
MSTNYNPQDPHPEYFKIINKATGRVLDGESQPSNVVYQGNWGDLVFQMWAVERLYDNVYRIINRADGRVLDGRAQPSSQIYRNDWNSLDYQKWRIEPVEDDEFKITNLADGRVIDGRDAPSVQVYRNNWNSLDFQRWQLEKIENTFDVTIINKADGRVLDGRANPSVEIYRNNWNKLDYQRWAIFELEDEEYKIVNLADSRVMESKSSSSSKVQRNGWGDLDRQKWRIEYLGDDQFQIENVADGRVLDGRALPSNDVYLNTWNELNYQRWSFGSIERELPKPPPPNMDRWMDSIHDDTFISEINIPGSHDSASINKNIYTLYATQGFTITEQLVRGIRLLDVRVSISKTNGEFVFFTCHGNIGSYFGVNEYQSLKSLLDECKEFLLQQTTETILMIIKVDDWNEVTGDDQKAALEQLKNLLSAYPIDTPVELPSLGACRGKIMLYNRINDETDLGAPIAFPYNKTVSPVSPVPGKR